VDSDGPTEAQIQSYWLGGYVRSWDGTLGPPGELRLNRPSAAAMRPYVKLL